MLDRLATDTMVAWYNRLLAREQWARTALAPYAGRTARIETGLMTLFVAVEAGGTLAPGSGAPSVTITVEPEAVASSLFEPATLLRKLRMEGDVAFAQALTDVLPKLRPDPAEELSRFVGDAPAERIVRTVRATFDALRDAVHRAARQGADYFVGEHPTLLGRQEWERFGSELATLQGRLDRLEERIKAQEASGATSSGAAAPTQPPGEATSDQRGAAQS
ncbi:MAG TPA: SCP2 sterol-binding domain-containing protein [Burkholderiaceae bacterium]|nr:SCP2 sterol-binding domain-containing protein [Burkholderiaceae bacterium]